MNVFRDPAKAEAIPMVPGGMERRGDGGGQPRFTFDTAQHSPVFGQFWELYQKDQAVKAARRTTPRTEMVKRIVGVPGR